MLLWVLVGLGALASLVLAALIAYATYLARWTTYVERLPLYGHPSEYGLYCEEVAVHTRDGVLLRGWYIPSKDDARCVIFVQGQEHHRNSPGIRALELARDLVAMGFSTLLFDLRGRGESGGNKGSAGNKELLDVLATIAFVKKRGIPPSRIGLIGFSLGAVLAIYAALGERGIPAIVCDSVYKDSLDDLKRLRVKFLHVPGWLIIPLVSVTGRVLFGSDPSKIRPIKVISKLQGRPVLFIHGEQDHVVPYSDSLALLQAYPNPKNEVWLVSNADHIRCYAVKRRAYVERVARFFNTYLD